MNNKLSITNGEWSIDVHLALIEKIGLLDRRLRDCEESLYGIAFTANADGRFISDNQSPPKTRTYQNDSYWTNNGWTFVPGGEWKSTNIGLNNSTAHYVWNSDANGNSVLASVNYTTP